MSYFSLRKRASEPDPELAEEDLDETEDEDSDEEQPTGTTNPLLVGILGPGNWIAARLGTGAAWGVHTFGLWACTYYGGWAAVGIVLAWLAAVLLFVPREAKDRTVARIESWNKATSAAPREAVAGAEDHEPDDPRTVLIRWLDDLTRGRSGIHLDELHQALTAHPQLAGLKRAEMRAWLDRHHIAVDRTLRVGAVAGRSGVSRSTVEALLEALPPLPESGPAETPVHAPDLHGSPTESDVERGGECAV